MTGPEWRSPLWCSRHRLRHIQAVIWEFVNFHLSLTNERLISMPMRRSSSDSPCEPVLGVAVAGLGQVRQLTLEQITLTQEHGEIWLSGVLSQYLSNKRPLSCISDQLCKQKTQYVERFLNPECIDKVLTDVEKGFPLNCDMTALFSPWYIETNLHVEEYFCRGPRNLGHLPVAAGDEDSWGCVVAWRMKSS